MGSVASCTVPEGAVVMQFSLVLLHLSGATMLLLWAVRMVRTGVERAFESSLREALRGTRNSKVKAAAAGAAQVGHAVRRAHGRRLVGQAERGLEALQARRTTSSPPQQPFTDRHPVSLRPARRPHGECAPSARSVSRGRPEAAA